MANIKNPGCATRPWALEFNRFAVRQESLITGPCRRGVTLVELLLVLALLVVIGAISAPLVGGTFSRARLEHSADLVRAAWTRARLAAAESGTTYVFRFEPNGSRYQLLKLADLTLPEAAMLLPDATGQRDAADILRLSENRLPEGVIFAGAKISASAQVGALLGETAGVGWSTPILFRPDGTTSDAQLILANERQQTLRVTLRGLTGVARVSDEPSEALR